MSPSRVSPSPERPWAGRPVRGAGSALCAPLPVQLGVTHSRAAGFLGQVVQTGNAGCRRLKTDAASLLSSSVGQADTERLRLEVRRKRPALHGSCKNL